MPGMSEEYWLNTMAPRFEGSYGLFLAASRATTWKITDWTLGRCHNATERIITWKF